MPSKRYVVFADVKKAISMSQVLEHYGLAGKLERKGDDELVGRCPIHEGESLTQFRVNLSMNAWKCFGPCGGGNILDFVAAKEDVSIREAALRLADWFSLPTGKPSRREGKPRGERNATGDPAPQDAAGSAKPTPADQGDSPETKENKPLSFELKNLDRDHDALRPLGLSASILSEFGAGYCAKGMLKGRLAIPIHSPAGELLAYAGLATTETPDGEPVWRYPENFDRTLEVFNLHRAAKTWDFEHVGLFVVADPLSVIRVREEAGFQNAVCLFGDELSDDQEEKLKRYLRPTAKVTVFLPEKQAASVAARLARSVYVRSGEPKPTVRAMIDAILDR